MGYRIQFLNSLKIVIRRRRRMYFLHKIFRFMSIVFFRCLGCREALPKVMICLSPCLDQANVYPQVEPCHYYLVPKHLVVKLVFLFRELIENSILQTIFVCLCFIIIYHLKRFNDILYTLQG